MFCIYCGAQLKEGTVFCHKCGKPVGGTPVQINESVGLEKLVRHNYGEEPERTNSKQGIDSLFKQYPWLIYVVIFISCLIVGGSVTGIVLHISSLKKEKKVEKDFPYSQEYGEDNEDMEWEDEADPVPASEEMAGEETIDFEYPETEPATEPIMEEEPMEEGIDSEYILPDSNSRVLSNSDLKGLSEEECRIARNEIYARHGRRFRDKEIQAYFDSKDWYQGTISPDDFKEDFLSDLEKENRDRIVEYEKDHGYNQR